MMKYFMGVCCAMLLGLSACGDIDSPEFPPSEVKSEVKEAVDFSYTELENLESTHGMHLNYHNRVYVLSADIVLDSPYQSFGHIEYFISPDKDNLTDKACCHIASIMTMYIVSIPSIIMVGKVLQLFGILIILIGRPVPIIIVRLLIVTVGVVVPVSFMTVCSKMVGKLLWMILSPLRFLRNTFLMQI